MYVLIQLFAIFLFLVAFIIPLFWCWGHAFAILLFVIASMAANNASNQREIIAELRGEQPAGPSLLKRLFILILLIIGALLVVFALGTNPPGAAG